MTFFFIIFWLVLNVCSNPMKNICHGVFVLALKSLTFTFAIHRLMNLAASKHFVSKRVIAHLMLFTAMAITNISCLSPVAINPVTNNPTTNNDIPKPLIPLSDATMANGCLNKTVPILWFFSWSSVPGAEMYNLYVKNHYLTGAVIDVQLTDSQFTSITYGYTPTQNSQYWVWKVRCRINGEWSDWSPEKIFHVGPLQTNCPG